jgi:hypothetical protein
MEENKCYRFVTTGDTALLHQEASLDVNANQHQHPKPLRRLHSIAINLDN